MKYGWIEVEQKPYTKDNIYTWHGPPIARVSKVMWHYNLYRWGKLEYDSDNPLNIGHDFEIGQFKLKIVDDDIVRDEYIVIRLDKINSYWYVFYKWMNMINSRILQTLCTWNLMDTDIACYPVWSDLKILRKFKR